MKNFVKTVISAVIICIFIHIDGIFSHIFAQGPPPLPPPPAKPIPWGNPLLYTGIMLGYNVYRILRKTEENK